MRLSLSLVTICFSTGLLAEVTRFQSSWDEGWSVLDEGGTCILRLAVPNYGEARFVATANTPTEFEFQARRDFQASDVDVARVAPDWHPLDGYKEHMGLVRHIPQGGAVARGQMVDAMLMALRDGYTLELRAAANFRPEGDIKWQLPAMHFIAAYDEFTTCAHTNLKVAWAQISRTRVPFEVDSSELDSIGRARLDAIVRFVLSDPEVTALYIDGHTDATGDRRKNRKLSERRARAVEKYLKEQGLNSRNLIVRYHGAEYPVADNKSAAGKALNRRATVRLSRDDGPKVAQN